MTTTIQAQAVDFIWRRWGSGEAARDLPPELKPRTRTEGYAIQAELDSLAGNTRAGWKIAATSESGQKHIAVDGPLAGRIYAQRLLAAGEKPSLAGNRMRVVEPEIALRMGRTLAPRAKPYGVDEVMAAVSDLHLSFEVPNSRFDPFTAVGGPTLIADDACAHQLLLGPAVTADWRRLDLANITVEAEVAGRFRREGTSANVLGDPRLAMTWIANELSALGIPLAAGEFVTTGTCMKPLEVEPGDRVGADYAGLGRLALEIAA
jgi:2-keto-4-pentenoate hydratase